MNRQISLALQASLVLVWHVLWFAAAGTATAGPNSGAKLILHYNPTLTFTTDGSQNWDGYSELDDCKDAATQISVADQQGVIFFVLAAFDNFASPRLKAASFGINYSSPQVAPIAYGTSGGDTFTVPDNGWPASGTGIGISWTYVLTRQMNEIYWFAAYSYSGNWFKVTGHPRLGGELVDDSVPPEVDYVADSHTGSYYDANYYGMVGFGRKGNNPCNPDEATGACCARSGACIIQTRSGCGQFYGYTYLGDDISCNPNPCEPGTGACCLNGECILMQWDECQTGGGIFRGDGVGCDPSPCNFGQSESSWGVLKNRFNR